jgi:hypothetical protein
LLSDLPHNREHYNDEFSWLHEKFMIWATTRFVDSCGMKARSNQDRGHAQRRGFF